MEKTKSLRELVAEKQIFAPCVWDLMSARAAEQAGYEATLLSGGALADWVCGLPDIGLITADDLVRATESPAVWTRTTATAKRRCTPTA